MKNLGITLSLFFFIICSQVFGQNIDMYAVTFGSPIYFGKVNLQNGELARIGSIDNSQSQLTIIFSSAFDQADGRFTFLSKEIFSQSLRFNSVDVTTGAQLPSPFIADEKRLYGLEYDLRTGKLYGLRFDSLNEVVILARINPQTGQIISENPIAGVTSFCSGGACNPTTAFDPARGTFIFIGNENPFTPRLYSVEASTGLVLKSPVFSPTVLQMEYNVTGDALYGIRFDTSLIGLFEINTDDASQQFVAHMNAQTSGVIGGSSCFHQQSETFIFGESTSSGSENLVFYNLKNNTLSKVLLSRKIWEPEIDNSAFATARFGLSPVSVEPLQEVLGINVFPNPAINQLRIETDPAHGQVESIVLSDMTGKKVLVKGNLNSSSYILDVSGLSKGMYQMRLTVGDQVVQKLINVNPQ